MSIRPLPRLAWAAVRPTSSDSITRTAALEKRSAPAALFVLAMIVQQRFVDPQVFLRLPDVFRRGRRARIEFVANQLLIGPDHEEVRLFHQFAAGPFRAAATARASAPALQEALHVETPPPPPRPMPPPIPPCPVSGINAAPTIFGNSGKWSRM